MAGDEQSIEELTARLEAAEAEAERQRQHAQSCEEDHKLTSRLLSEANSTISQLTSLASARLAELEKSLEESDAALEESEAQREADAESSTIAAVEMQVEMQSNNQECLKAVLEAGHRVEELQGRLTESEATRQRAAAESERFKRDAEVTSRAHVAELQAKLESKDRDLQQLRRLHRHSIHQPIHSSDAALKEKRRPIVEATQSVQQLLEGVSRNEANVMIAITAAKGSYKLQFALSSMQYNAVHMVKGDLGVCVVVWRAAMRAERMSGTLTTMRRTAVRMLRGNLGVCILVWRAAMRAERIDLITGEPHTWKLEDLEERTDAVKGLTVCTQGLLGAALTIGDDTPVSERSEGCSGSEDTPAWATAPDGIGRQMQLIAFERVEFYAYKHDEAALLTIVRSGSSAEQCSICWSTTNINIQPSQYRDESGKVTFLRGERKKEVSIPMHTNPTGWDIERQMAVELCLIDANNNRTILGELYKTVLVVFPESLFPGILALKREYYLMVDLVLPRHLQFDHNVFISTLKGFLQGLDEVTINKQDHTLPFLSNWHKCGCSEYNIEVLRTRLRELECGRTRLDSMYETQLKENEFENPLHETIREDQEEKGKEHYETIHFAEGTDLNELWNHNTVWGCLWYIYKELGREAHIGAAVLFYASISWVISQLVLLIAISEGVEKQRIWPLYVMAGVYLVDVNILHSLRLKYISLRLSGKAKTLLREKAVYTMLQMTMQERERIESGKAITTIIAHVEEVVMNGWIAGVLSGCNICECAGCAAFDMFGGIMKFIMMMGVTAYVAGGIGLVFAMAILGIDVISWRCRWKHRLRLLIRLTQADDNWKDDAMECTQHRDLIIMYRQGQQRTKRFLSKHQVSNDAFVDLNAHDEWTTFIAHSTSAIVLLFAFIYFGNKVVQDEDNFDVGEFVTLMNVLFSFDEQISQVMHAYNQILSTFDSLIKVSALLNSETRRTLLLKRQLIRTQLLDDSPITERDKIIVAPGTKVMFVTLEHSTTREACVKFPKDGLLVPQGGVVLVQGHASHAQRSVVGKSTFLKALARIYLPHAGFIYFPDNLRVRLLDTEPEILSDSVSKNLEFGNQHKHDPRDVRALCHLLRISRYLWDDAEVDAHGNEVWGVALAGANGHRLSVSDRVKLSIARALLSSVHLLLLNNTLDLLDVGDALHIITVLDGFCEQRGVGCLRVDMIVPWKLRKKTTVLVSTRNAALEAYVPTRIVLERQIHMDVQEAPTLKPKPAEADTSSEMTEELGGWFTASASDDHAIKIKEDDDVKVLLQSSSPTEVNILLRDVEDTELEHRNEFLVPGLERRWSSARTSTQKEDSSLDAFVEIRERNSDGADGWVVSPRPRGRRNFNVGDHGEGRRNVILNRALAGKRNVTVSDTAFGEISMQRTKSSLV